MLKLIRKIKIAKRAMIIFTIVAGMSVSIGTAITVNNKDLVAKADDQTNQQVVVENGQSYVPAFTTSDLNNRKIDNRPLSTFGIFSPTINNLQVVNMSILKKDVNNREYIKRDKSDVKKTKRAYMKHRTEKNRKSYQFAQKVLKEDLLNLNEKATLLNNIFATKSQTYFK